VKIIKSTTDNLLTIAKLRCGVVKQSFLFKFDVIVLLIENTFTYWRNEELVNTNCKIDFPLCNISALNWGSLDFRAEGQELIVEQRMDYFLCCSDFQWV
jgi:hypothetical protein